MRMTLRFVKRNIFGFLLGIIFCSFTVVLAESINSNEVLYDNSNSKTSYDNVQDVLDNLYNIYDHIGVGFSLLTRNPSDLSTELIDGLYRYQGIQNVNNNVDNYICFGTTSKSTCINDTNKYMYRIIGINTSGQMKLIKKEALNTSYQWNSSTGVEWYSSDLYNGLNGNYFLTNTTYIPDNTWSNRIVLTDWHYFSIASRTLTNIGEQELAAPSISAKIGLMYLHDIQDANSWINMENNDTNAPQSKEWLITRWDYRYIFVASPNGVVTYADMTVGNMINSYSVRPVFFLNSNERIASGSGTITDPYILS